MMGELAMELQYIRTDKNGTKIYQDWNCPRCAGAGQANKWRFTGLVCFACGGTGKRNSPKVVREYTPEYWAKLEAKRIAKDRKRIEEARRYAEEHLDEIEEKNRQLIIRRYAEHGCGPDGVGYVLKGNTYKARDAIRAAGGKWIYGEWVCPKLIEGEGINAKRIDLGGHIGAGSEYWLDDFDFYEAIKC